MSLYTVTQQTTLITTQNILSNALGSIMGKPEQGPQLNAGDLVTVSDPPQTQGAFTQVTTANGTVGYVPTNVLSAGIVGSTIMNVGIGVAALFGIWYFFIRK